MKMNPLSDVFFDLDHTLWDFDKNSALAFELLFEKYTITISVAEFLVVYRPINMRYWKLYREEQVTKIAMRRGRLQDAFAVLGIVVPMTTIDAMADDYIHFLPINNYLIDGAIDVLNYLTTKYKLHIITNGFTQVQQQKIRKAELAHFFETVTDSEQVGVKKPNPKIFEYALEQAGATAATSVMIGDNYEADIMGAAAVGMQTICFNCHALILPDEVLGIDTLSELKQLI